MYRSQKFMDVAEGRSVLDIALDVHATKQGSFVRSPEDQDQDIEALKEVLRAWRPSSGTEEFDNAVKQVIKAALDDNSDVIIKKREEIFRKRREQIEAHEERMRELDHEYAILCRECTHLSIDYISDPAGDSGSKQCRYCGTEF